MEEFPNITDNFALNFCNSKIIRNDKSIDLIQTMNDLKVWSEIPVDGQVTYNTQLSIFNSCLDGVKDINQLLRIRDDFSQLVRGIAKKEIIIDALMEKIETFILQHPFTIIFVEDQPLYVPVDSGMYGIESLMYLSLSELVKTGEINKLSCCANEKCPLIFINSNGRRKWCSMKRCGNRNKVERYENKQKRAENKF